MPDSRDVQREEVHHRQIDLRFYRRSDGLYEVEGHLVDRKAHAFRRLLADEDTPPGTPLHDIRVRLVIDAALRVHDATATMAATPFDLCREAEQTLSPLIGLHIGSGWNRQVRELLAGAACCTHIRELLGPMATTALQGFAPLRLARLESSENAHLRKARIDSCYAFGAQREVVARLWPELRKQPD